MVRRGRTGKFLYLHGSFSGLNTWIVVLTVELNQRRADDKSEIARLCKYTHFISILLVEILMPFDAVLFVKAGEFTCSR